MAAARFYPSRMPGAAIALTATVAIHLALLSGVAHLTRTPISIPDITIGPAISNDIITLPAEPWPDDASPFVLYATELDIDWSHCAMPKYPATARRHRLEGVVSLFLLTDETGRVTQASVGFSSGHDLLDAAALSAFRACTFIPPVQSGHPVAARRMLDYEFGRDHSGFYHPFEPYSPIEPNWHPEYFTTVFSQRDPHALYEVFPVRRSR